MLIDCIIKGWQRRLQLIGFVGKSMLPVGQTRSNSHKCPTPLEVIEGFDLTHCQIAFDGNDVICTPEFVKSITNRTTTINPLVHSIHGYRLVKAYLRGYSVVQPDHNVYIRNFYHRYGDEDEKDYRKVLRLTDRIWQTHFMRDEFADLLKNPVVHQNLHKSFIVDFSLEMEQRIKQIDQLSNWSPMLYVFNRYGQLMIERMGNNHYVAQRDDESDLPSKINLNQMIQGMHVTNILTR